MSIESRIELLERSAGALCEQDSPRDVLLWKVTDLLLTSEGDDTTDLLRKSIMAAQSGDAAKAAELRAESHRKTAELVRRHYGAADAELFLSMMNEPRDQ